MAKWIFSEDGNSAICDITGEVYYFKPAEGQFLNKSLQGYITLKGQHQKLFKLTKTFRRL